jgi:F-type H+-transporting ATPase subunit b
MTIDWWTIGIQTVNVVVLVWLLGHFFWRPVAAMIEQRRAAAQKTLDEAAAKQTEAAAALTEIEKTRAGFAREKEAILGAAHEEAERARTARLDDAAKAATTLEEAARARIEQDKLATEKAWSERAGHLAVEIAERLAARLDGPTVRGAFLEWLVNEIQQLPEPARQAMAANDVALEAVSAAPLEPAEQERYRALIREAVGGHPRIEFTSDPTLIAGLELHGPHLVVSNSWRADLTKILTEIGHDNRS